MDEEKIIGYNAFSAAGVHTTSSTVIEAGGDSKSRSNNDTTVKCDGDTCSTCMQAGMLILNTLLTFIFAIVIIVLTAVGKENISTYDGSRTDKKCDCTSLTPSLSYGLAVSLFIEIGLMVTMIILAGITTLTNNDKYSKLLNYYGYAAGSFIGLNFIVFLCMTIAVIVYVAMGTSACCSATSIVVASLSTFLVVIKTVFVCCLCCILFVND